MENTKIPANRGKKTVWLPEIEERLIDLFEEREVLYNMALPGYHITQVKDQAYREIAQELGVEVNEVKKHIRSLRTQYTRDSARGTSGGSPKRLSVRAKFIVERLGFLKQYVKRQMSRSSMDEEENMQIGSELDEDVDSNDVERQICNAKASEARCPNTSRPTVSAKQSSIEKQHSEKMAVLSEFAEVLRSSLEMRKTEMEGGTDEISCWAKLVALRIRKLPTEEQRMNTMLKVDGLIYAEMQAIQETEVHNSPKKITVLQNASFTEQPYPMHYFTDNEY